MRDIKEAASYIVGEGSLERRTHIEHILQPVKEQAVAVTLEDMLSVSEPQLPALGFRFNYSYDELIDIAHHITGGTPEEIDRVFRYGMVYSGIVPEADCIDHVYRDLGYGLERFPRVTARIHDKRLSLRVLNVDGEISNSSKPTSSCFRYKKENGKEFIVNGNYKAQITGRYYGASVNVLSYTTDAPGGIDMTINPIMKCPNSCKMCCRTYDLYTDKCNLFNFEPEEMARYLMWKYGVQTLKALRSVAIITGAFHSPDEALDYIEKLNSCLSNLTSGGFDPIHNDGQFYKISSHHFDSIYYMEKLRGLGVKQYMYSVEMVSDNRKEILTNGEILKGKLKLSSIKEVLESAISVWGNNYVEPTYVIGLDSFEDTFRWIDLLSSIGITKMTRALYNAYSPEQCRYYKMDLKSTLVCALEINRRFSSGYHQYLKGNLKKREGWSDG